MNTIFDISVLLETEFMFWIESVYLHLLKFCQSSFLFSFSFLCYMLELSSMFIRRPIVYRFFAVCSAHVVQIHARFLV